MQPERRRPLTELVFLARGGIAVRAAIVLVVGLAVGVAGVALARLELSLASQAQQGAALNPLQAFAAGGSGPRTAWIGWAAAVCFVVAAMRLRRGPLEPSLGRGSIEQLSAERLRAGLRREYRFARALVLIVVLVAMVDAARAGALFSGARVPGDVALWTVVEVAGLCAAALALAVWAWWFGGDVRRVGAL